MSGGTELLGNSHGRGIVPKDVHALFDAGDALGAADGFNHAVARDRRPIRETQDPIGS